MCIRDNLYLIRKLKDLWRNPNIFKSKKVVAPQDLFKGELVLYYENSTWDWQIFA